jgi:hypothetical protein
MVPAYNFPVNWRDSQDSSKEIVVATVSIENLNLKQ